jgi:hypothetical protein
MKSIIQLKTATPPLLIILVIACFALSPGAQAIGPEAPDAALPRGNTADGDGALSGLTGGFYNSAFGFLSLLSNADASFNTGVGAGALLVNTANENTATGAGALLSNTTGFQNTANGTFALFNNTTGTHNTATGYEALFHNTNVGGDAGADNTALGFQALFNNILGFLNTADGSGALFNNTIGNNNTAVGGGALVQNTEGDNNTALGFQAGLFQDTGNGNVYIGAGMAGVAGENNACYIASIFGQTSASGVPVLINSSNKLGTTTSSKRFKENIKPMSSASEPLFALKPVTFRYKKEIDPAGTSQLGLVAEEVEQVNPDLVVRDKEGKPYSVRYDQINAMLLNEFLKEHNAFLEERSKVQQLEAALEAVNARLKEQDARIEKVTAQLEVNKQAPTLVRNNQ